uniref:Acetyltransf_18 domain-containing protein n=1 Tax=Caenorhabditis tropicalis TaxID=1561998 RepID=A0A1I7UGX0_9PELO
MLDRDGFAKVAYSDKDGKVCGIGQSIIYENKMDCNIGPLYADEPRVAQTIFSHMLNDIQQSGKKVSRFEVRSAQMAPNSFRWLSPFLKCEQKRSHICNLVYKHSVPKNIAFEKVYCPTHAQLFMV